MRIAAYREFDLVPTLRDMTAMAADPDALRICICWQHTPDDSLAEFAADPRVDLIDVDHIDSQGMCWARNLIQLRWDGEPYTLGIDGHHRFVPNWDRALVERLTALQEQGIEKPVLGGYAPAFDPANDPAGRAREVWLTGVDRFEERGVLFMRPFVPDPLPTVPVPARFWSGHFNFTVGPWNEEVPTDPNGYFHSEEIVMTVRSWTSGYDLFNPDRTILWHEYSRAQRVCHWDEHPDWTQMSDAAIADYKRLFRMDGQQPEPGYAYGFGSDRTLRDYERYAGVDFAERGVQEYTFANAPPPNPPIDESDWKASLRQVVHHNVYVPRSAVDRDCDAWSLAVHADDGTELHRQEYSALDVRSVLEFQDGPLVELEIRMLTNREPASWRLTPHTPESGDLEPMEHLWPSA